VDGAVGRLLQGLVPAVTSIPLPVLCVSTFGGRDLRGIYRSAVVVGHQGPFGARNYTHGLDVLLVPHSEAQHVVATIARPETLQSIGPTAAVPIYEIRSKTYDPDTIRRRLEACDQHDLYIASIAFALLKVLPTSFAVRT